MARKKHRAKLPDPLASPIVRQAFAALGRKGGPARMATLTAEERTALARKAAEARWGKKAGRRRSRPSP